MYVCIYIYTYIHTCGLGSYKLLFTRELLKPCSTLLETKLIVPTLHHEFTLHDERADPWSLSTNHIAWSLNEHFDTITVETLQGLSESRWYEFSVLVPMMVSYMSNACVPLRCPAQSLSHTVLFIFPGFAPWMFRAKMPERHHVASHHHEVCEYIYIYIYTHIPIHIHIHIHIHIYIYIYAYLGYRYKDHDLVMGGPDAEHWYTLCSLCFSSV